MKSAPNNQMYVGVCCGVDMVEEARLQGSAVTMHNACTQQSNGCLCLLSNRYGRGGKLQQRLMKVLMTKTFIMMMMTTMKIMMFMKMMMLMMMMMMTMMENSPSPVHDHMLLRRENNQMEVGVFCSAQ